MSAEPRGNAPIALPLGLHHKPCGYTCLPWTEVPANMRDGSPSLDVARDRAAERGADFVVSYDPETGRVFNFEPQKPAEFAVVEAEVALIKSRRKVTRGR